MQLPFVKTDDQSLMLMQTRWQSIINPVLALPILDGRLINNIPIQIGLNYIDHKLGRKQRGWIVADVDFTSQIYRDPSRPLNDKTLYLISDQACTLALWVF